MKKGLALFGLAGAILLGCTRFFGKPTLVIATTELPASLDTLVCDPASEAWLRLTQGSLVRLDRNGAIQPGLAERWERDKTRLLFHLSRQLWSDGVELEAEQFVRSWQRHLAPGSRSPYLKALFAIQGGQAYHNGRGVFSEVGLRALDQHTLEVRLQHSDHSFLRTLATPCLGPQRNSPRPAQGGRSLFDLRAIGAYQILDWNERTLSLAANSYFAHAPDITRIRFDRYSSLAEARQAFDAGRAQILDVPGLRLKKPSLDALPERNRFIDYAEIRWVQ